MKELITNVLPGVDGLEKVDFTHYQTPYVNLLNAFKESGKSGLTEFTRFVQDHGVVGRFLISVLQYLLIRYRRFEDENVEIPAFEVFKITKEWLNEHGFERDYKKLLHSFTGYIVEIAEKISLREGCSGGESYLKAAYNLAVEAEETFEEAYFVMLRKRVEESLKNLREHCSPEK